jgi:hypothetical protein
MGNERVIISLIDTTEIYSTGSMCQVDYDNNVVKGKRTDLDGKPVLPLEEFIIPLHAVLKLSFVYGD